MPKTSDTQRTSQNIMLVTGLSGAGKSTALRTLEDLGWEAVDNFPIRLLGRLLETPLPAATGIRHAPLAIGFDSRTRGFDPEAIIRKVESLNSKTHLSISTLYLDCSGAELERRYNETRRPHPLAKDRLASNGIALEREMMQPLRDWAEHIMDTTAFAANELQQAIREQFMLEEDRQPTLTITSFGFARGMPPVADLVFDMRFLRNPHWDSQLRPLTGQDKAVGEYVRQDKAFEEAYCRILDLISFLLPRYAAQGKAYVNIAFGCTGGRHRSVFTAEQMAKDLRDAGFSPTISHRNLASPPADKLEGKPNT
ncbi:RNase adapter RapZ [Sphingorhabdus sp. Alg239-R122]|uniref:RNase adapter RapZ n=1 Tax=Sphingorhabdus sp. Alg239-R122 TaxID=2305989 RepID=UPI001F0851E0|nr:RNase adapter RapZ [Sphingorhabdus sp. Alg239-R122]